MCFSRGRLVSEGNLRIKILSIAFALFAQNPSKSLCILPITFFAKMLYNKHIEDKILPLCGERKLFCCLASEIFLYMEQAVFVA